MDKTIDLKELEQRAFRSTFQDGLWDIHFGIVMICMAFFLYHPASGYSPLNIIAMVVAVTLSYALFMAGKKYIILPRMGKVRFGAQRARRARTMVLVLGLVVLIQVLIVALQLYAWAHPVFGTRINGFLAERNIMDLAVAAVGALLVGPSMVLVAYFRDFPRGYYIAGMMALAVFLTLYFNQPILPIVIGSLVALPGIVLLVRFLRQYPLPREEAEHE